MFGPLLVIALALGSLAPGSPGSVPASADVSKSIEPEVGDISGYYTCKGLELGGKTYSGIAVITKKNDVYLIQWVIGSGSTFTGLGLRQGNTLAASWAVQSERGLLRGVNLYRIEPGPRLVGRWTTLPGPGVHQSETLTFLKKLDTEED